MKSENHFIDSLGYELELSARVCHETFKRWFEKNTNKYLSVEEFIILDTLDCNKNFSQIELANATLKGKAHTGKFLDSLEEKGLITRLYDTKNSRMVKIPVMTDLGKKTYNEIKSSIKQQFDRIHETIPKDEIQEVKEKLRKFREAIIEVENISFN